VWAWHGTSSTLLPDIMEHGLDPEKTGLTGKEFETSTPGVFLSLTGDVDVYARRAVAVHGGEPVVLRVLVDAADLEPDPDDADIESGLTQVIHRGHIDPSQIYQVDGQWVRTAAKVPLIAAHNLTSENLRYADKIGGLVAPSIAIFNPEHGFSDFGEITLLAPMSLVDPDTTPVYDADVYSPRYPNVYHKPEGKALRKFEEEYKPYAERTKAYLGDLAHNIEFRGGSEEGLRQMLAPLRLAFLEQVKGMQIESVMRQVPVNPEWAGAPSLTAFFAEHGRDVNADMNSPYWDAFSQAAQQAVREFYAPLDPEDREMMLDASFDHYFEAGPGRLFFGPGDKVLRAAGNVGKSEVDQYAFQDRLEELIAPYEAEFEAWARPQVDALVAGQYLKTPGGAKREYTPENVLKAMSPKNIRSGEGFNYGLGSLRAKGAKKFRTFSQMERAAENLVDAEEMATLKEANKDRFWKLVKKLAPYHPASGEFGFSDAVISALGESYKRGRSLMRELRSDGFRDVPPHLVEALEEFKQDLVSMPTEYFEAKPRRLVDLNEFIGAIIPEDASQSVHEVLTAHDIPFATYNREESKTRIEALQQLTGAEKTAANMALPSKQRALQIAPSLGIARLGLAPEVASRLFHPGLQQAQR